MHGGGWGLHTRSVPWQTLGYASLALASAFFVIPFWLVGRLAFRVLWVRSWVGGGRRDQIAVLCCACVLRVVFLKLYVALGVVIVCCRDYHRALVDSGASRTVGLSQIGGRVVHRRDGGVPDLRVDSSWRRTDAVSSIWSICVWNYRSCPISTSECSRYSQI